MLQIVTDVWNLLTIGFYGGIALIIAGFLGWLSKSINESNSMKRRNKIK